MSLQNLLQARTDLECRQYRNSSISELEAIFDPNTWEIHINWECYTPSNIGNLWKNELRTPIKNAIENAANGQERYETWLPEIHYIFVAISYKPLFSEYKANKGWRIAAISVPALRVAALGLASHYQGTQRHAALGHASQLLFDVAADRLSSQGNSLELPGRKVRPSDWDHDGLVQNPITSIADVDLSQVPNVDHLFLKDVRTTTVKKTLASFINVDPLRPDESPQDTQRRLSTLEKIGRSLAETVYPFRSIEEFESLRSLALQDPASASIRVQLRQKSSTRSLVQVYYGPPGTGKTLAAVIKALELVDPHFDEKDDPEVAFARFNELTDKLAFITFHPALQYEDVVESIRPTTATQHADGEVRSLDGPQPGDEPVGAGNEESSGGFEIATGGSVSSSALTYHVHEGLLLRMIRRAAINPDKEYALVIDEINRGDIGRILGPLMSAIEPDKRVGAEYPIGVELQYPRAQEIESRLFVPPNVHFLGTMNSADRNIALVDHALRRRFDFVHCPPKPSFLSTTNSAEPIDTKGLLESLNRRIGHLLDSDHEIGHGYFMHCRENLDVIRIFAKKILPLLIEYFYGNPRLVLLVLGEGGQAEYRVTGATDTEAGTEELFGIPREDAIRMGYRAQNVNPDIRLNPIFWDESRAVPGPQDETYAAQALRKIYQPGN